MNVSGAVHPDRPEFVLERTFDAPLQLVYTIWTDPKYVQEWWGVEGSTIVVCELDVRPGGKFRIDMKASDGTVYVNRGTYLDVVVNERIVTKDDRDANVPPGNIPAGIHTVTFAGIERRTLVTLTSRFETIEDRDLMVRYGMLDGIRQSLAKFERLVMITMQERQQA